MAPLLSKRKNRIRTSDDEVPLDLNPLIDAVIPQELVNSRIKALTRELHGLEHKGDSQQTHSEESEIDG